MPDTLQTNFNAGELSPQVYGRPDLAKYENGLKKLFNTVCLMHGPATRRPGIEYIAGTKTNSSAARLLDFEFSITQAYMLEFGATYIRFFRNGGAILHTATITNVTLNNPIKITATNRYVNGQSITISEVVGTTELNGNTYTVANVSSADYELSGIDGTSGFSGYTSDGEAEGIYEIASPYAAADLDGLDWTQSADTMYLDNGDYHPRELSRSDHDNWTLTKSSFVDGPYNAENDTSTTMTPSGTTGTITITASATTGINSDDGFKSTDVDRLISILQDTTWGIAKITVFLTDKTVTALVLTDFKDGTSVDTWKIGAWSDTDGWPKFITFDNDRLCHGASDTYPQREWQSKVGLYTDFGVSSTTVADDGLDLTLGAKKINVIQWMTSVRRLALGTTGAEWWLTNSTGDGQITALSKQAVPGSYNGSSAIKPVEIGSTIIYLQRFQKVLGELIYSFETDSYQGDILTIIAEHLTRSNTISRMVFQRNPWRVLWCLRDDGKLMGLTYYKEQDVWGWHLHETDGVIESLSVIPGTSSDELWMIVNRTIDDSTVRYVERLHTVFNPDPTDDTTDAFFVDSGDTLDGRIAITGITNADPCVITTTSAHGWSNADTIRIRKVVGVEDDDGDTLGAGLNNFEFVVRNVGAQTAELELESVDFDSSDLTEYSSGGTAAVNVTSISGLDHLEGESVTILADGSPVANQTVASGSITLPHGASVVHVGMNFISEIITFPPSVTTPAKAAGGVVAGFSVGSMSRITNIILHMFESLGFKYGPDEDNLFEQAFADDNVPLGQPAPMLSGFTEDTSFDGPFSRDPNILIRQDQPLPMTILGIYADIEEE